MSAADAFEKFLRDELERLDEPERLLRECGDVKRAERVRRDNVRLRKRIEGALEGLPARRTAAAARCTELLRGALAELERQVAEK